MLLLRALSVVPSQLLSQQDFPRTVLGGGVRGGSEKQERPKKKKKLRKKETDEGKIGDFASCPFL